jgi:hypothetical protein
VVSLYQGNAGKMTKDPPPILTDLYTFTYISMVQ